MVRRREETKRDHLKMTVNIFEKRVEMRDFNGAVYSELNSQYKNTRCVPRFLSIMQKGTEILLVYLQARV